MTSLHNTVQDILATLPPLLNFRPAADLHGRLLRPDRAVADAARALLGRPPLRAHAAHALLSERPRHAQGQLAHSVK